MTLQPPTPSSAARLRALFARAEFEPAKLSKALGPNEASSSKHHNRGLLLRRTAEPTLLHTLLRWFLIGADIEKQQAAATLSPQEVDDLLACGLVEEAGGSYRSPLMVSPYEGFLLAADRLTALESGDSPDAVLMVNRTTWRLGQLMLREPVETTLDLGTGCGALALAAARHSREVVATDLNPRAIRIARFNAALNGVENVEWLEGDLWEPVAGRRFDRIISNPPFFLSPDNDSLFCDNPFELDGLCRRLIQEADDYLNPDGFCQMIFEWAEVDGEPWRERLLSWIDDVDCDVWIAKGYSLGIDRYALQRITEKAVTADEAESRFERWMRYFTGKGVLAIHGGLVALRRRTGPGWVRISEQAAVREGADKALRDRFTSLDYAHGSPDDEEMLQTRPRLREFVEMSQQLRLIDGGWKATGMQLELRDGLPDSLPADRSTLGLLTALDGSRTIAEVAEAVARQSEQDPALVAAECVRLIRALAERGFVTDGAELPASS